MRRTLVVVTAKKLPVVWTENDDIYNWDWELLIVFWDEEQKLLFINSSSNEGVFKSLARAVAGDDVELVNEHAVFRTFAGINRLTLQNVGLTEQLGRLIRYTGRMGSDVESGLSEAQKRNTRRSVLSGKGFENGKRVTVGASRKGRIWSMRRSHIEELVAWCKRVGAKVLNETIDPSDILKGTLESTTVSVLPDSPAISADWPESVYTEPETTFELVVDGEQPWPLHETELVLVEHSTLNEIRFAISSGDATIEVQLDLFERDGVKDYRFSVRDGKKVAVHFGSSEIPLEDFFYDDPPILWFASGASLEGNTFTPLKTKYPPYPREKIVVWDWQGVDLRKEAQGAAKDRESIQFRVIAALKERGRDVVFDDDGSGEAADVVSVQVMDERSARRWIEVEFHHCKYSKREPGQRIKDLYEVSGQAQKSIRWMYSHEKQTELFTHLLRRDANTVGRGKPTRFEVGNRERLQVIREMSRSCPVKLSIYVVQPGLSKANATTEQLELLSVTENHLIETYQLPFVVIANE